jgi:ERCC4-type nuclease
VTGNCYHIPAELPTESIIAIVDTREQTPLDLPRIRTESGTLTTGDYSVRGLEHVVAVERKSLDDLVACCGRERDRFDREVQRLLAYPVRALVVEAYWTDIEASNWRGKLTTRQVGSSLISWLVRGLPVVMAGDRERAGRIVSAILRRAAIHRWREARQLIKAVEDATNAKVAVESWATNLVAQDQSGGGRDQCEPVTLASVAERSALTRCEPPAVTGRDTFDAGNATAAASKRSRWMTKDAKLLLRIATR